MPEYLPPPQLPQGLAEQLIALKSHSGDPWSALAQSLGNSVQQGIQSYAQRKANAPLNTAQQAAMGIRSPAPTTGPVQIGQTPMTQAGGGPAFAKGMSRDLASQILQRQTQEDIARETTARMMGVQSLKGNQAESKLNIPVTDTTRALFQKAGLPIEDGAATVRHEDYEAAIKKVLSGQKIAGATAAAKIKASQQPTQQQKERASEFDQREWDKVLTQSTPSMAGSRKGLGVAYNNNMRADRLLMTNDAKVLPQQLDLMMADLQGIYQGGQPHAAAMDRSAISNLSTKIADFKQKITSDPQFIESREWVKVLKDIIREVKKVDNRAIRSHMDDIEKSQPRVIEKYKDAWKAHKEEVLNQLEESKGGAMTLEDILKNHGVQ